MEFRTGTKKGHGKISHKEILKMLHLSTSKRKLTTNHDQKIQTSRKKENNVDTSLHYTYLDRQSVKKQKVVNVKLLKWTFFIYNSPAEPSGAKNSETKQKDKCKKRKFTEIF